MLGAAVVASGALRLLPQHLVDDPNDFPVASYLPPSGPVDVAVWRLSVTGAVSNPLSLSYNDLLALPRDRQRFALRCVTGWSTTQSWEGIRISELLGIARPRAQGAVLRLSGADGHWVELRPSQYERPDVLVTTHVAGAPLTHDHGFPARLMMPDIDGVSDGKWLVEIQVLGG